MAEATASRTRTRQPPEVRRAQILDAASRVFLEEGLSSTTMDDVASAAGVAKGTVYLYFRSKEELVEALQARFAERLVTRARRLLDARSGERADQLDRYLSGVVDDMFDYSDLQHLLFHQAPTHGTFDEIHGVIRSFIDRGVGSGEFHVSDPDLTARFLVEGLHGVLVQATHDPRPGKRVVREMVIEAARRLLSIR
jgi:AcrR family transcriptional regulator